TRAVIEPAAARRIRVRSETYSETTAFDLDDSHPQPRHHWSDYVRGVAIMLEREGCRLRGANLAVSSNISVGAGLSSSAALEVAAALAMLGNSNCTLDRLKIAQLAQRAENEFVGAKSGIMDQFAA